MDRNTQAASRPHLVDAQVEGWGPRAKVLVLAGVAVYVSLQPPDSSVAEVPSLAVLGKGHRIGPSAVCLEQAERPSLTSHHICNRKADLAEDCYPSWDRACCSARSCAAQAEVTV